MPTYQMRYDFEPLTPEQRKEKLDPDNPVSPYYGFIGNRKAINKLIRIDFDALGREDHLCNKLSLAFVGQAGSGKTELARRHARANELPLVEISPRSVKTLDAFFGKIREVCEDVHRFCPWIPESMGNVPLLEVVNYDNYYLPPLNILIDEVHALSNTIVQGLLKATAPNDGMLATESGRRVNCSQVHWMIATTDRGRLFDAFDTRFSKINLSLYTKAEIGQIVKSKKEFAEWPWEACKMAAHYCSRVPREALAFAKEMQMEMNMRPNSWAEAASRVATDNEIDEHGMTHKRLLLLKALGQQPVAEKRLPIVVGVKWEELEKFILPWLLAFTDDQPALVTVGPRGYYITEAGLAELDKRSLHHRGQEVLAA